MKAIDRVFTCIAAALLGTVLAMPAYGAVEDKATAGIDPKEGEAKTLPLTNDWYEGAECDTCHAAQVESFALEECLAHKHEVLECASCHNIDDLAGVHGKVTEKTKLPKKLKKTKMDTGPACGACHDAGALAEATKDSTVLTDTKGTTINPHDLPVNDDHASQVSCVSCHKVHAESDLEKSANKVCESCHHEKVYECGTCHKA